MVADLGDVFANLAIVPSDEPLPEPTRGSTGGPNPFIAPLHASVEHGKAYSIYVPGDKNKDGQYPAVQRAVFLINAAARKENLGVRVVVNVKRDKDGKIVKDDKGKAQPLPETSGDNKGKVLVRFQGKKERKQQTAPRPYSVVPIKGEEGQFGVRRRSDKALLFKGTKDAAKAEYDRLKAEYNNTPVEQRHDYVAPAVTPAPAAEGTAPVQETDGTAQTPDPATAPQPAAATA